MWKVRPNISFADLEKFGYRLEEFDYVANKPYNYVLYVKEVFRDAILGYGVVILVKDGVVEVRKCYSYSYQILDDNDCQFYINDLIRAEMLERIGS